MDKILIIEDDQPLRSQIAKILRFEGFEVAEAENGKTGVASAIDGAPDLIICDIMMPELDGFGVLQQLRGNPRTALIPFTFLTALAANPQLKPMLEAFETDVKLAATETNRVAREAKLKKWEQARAAAKAAGKREPKRPKVFEPEQDQHSPTVMFNGVIAPVIPFAIRGVLWYQGESITTGGVALYPLLQSTLIQDWRRLWNEGDFPFYVCQLAAFNPAATDPNVPGKIPATREAQATVLSLPNTGVAVTIDIGDAANIHPKNKQDLGDRLTRIALAKVYGRQIEYSGPMFEAMKVEGRSIRVTFSHVGGGLMAKGGPLRQFAIAGADGQFVWADAVIAGGSVVVSSPQVAAPVAVRYAWADNPAGCNLYNS